ncbi:MAG: putative lipid II flippase FtsW [Alphaproteobacteria bacterium]
MKLNLHLDRRNTTALGRWWWTLDRPAFFAMMALVSIGVFLVAAASPPVALRLGYSEFHFVTRHQIFLIFAVLLLVMVSALPILQVRRLSMLILFPSLIAMALLPLIGFENKGAVRWLHFAGISIQPSEFMKPCFAVVAAWIFTLRYRLERFPSFRLATALYGAIVFLLILQPDFGMIVTVSAMFAVQFFLAGMPLKWVLGMVLIAVIGVFVAYHSFGHVAGRIDRFLDPSSGDNYQVEVALKAFTKGGFLGAGPGEGVVKQHIPDAHTDFIFAVAGEEFGLIFCLMIVAIFAFIVVRGFLHLGQEEDLFTILAAAGLLTQFGVQAIVNMGVAVNLLPAKGMTLPFLSYGGSSLMAMALGMGVLLALTRKQFGRAKI